MSLKKRIMELGKKHPRVIVAIMMLMLVGTSLGAWLISSQADADIMVTSAGGMTEFSVDFTDLNLDTTEDAVSETTTATLSNSDGERSIRFIVDETFTDNGNDSCDNTDDCTLSYKLDDVAISDEDEVTLSSGDTAVMVQVDCIKLSCPQNLNTLISIQDLGEAPDTTSPVIEILVDLPQGTVSGTISDNVAVTGVILQVRNYPDDVILLSSKVCTFDNLAGTFSCAVVVEEMGGSWTSVNLEVTAVDLATNTGTDLHQDVNWN